MRCKIHGDDRTNGRILCGVRLLFFQPFDQSCWTGVGVLGAALATGVMVARLRTINTTRIKYVIGILHLFGSGEMSGSDPGHGRIHQIR